MINFLCGAVVGVFLTVTVPAVYAWGVGAVAKLKKAKDFADTQ